MCLSAGAVPTGRKVVVLETIIILSVLSALVILTLAVCWYHMGPIGTAFAIAGSVSPLLPFWWLDYVENDYGSMFLVALLAVSMIIASMVVCFWLASWFGDKYAKRHKR